MNLVAADGRRTLLRDRVLWVGIAALSVAIALFSYRYLLGPNHGGGLVPEQIAANAFFRPFLFLHVAGAATALLVGPWQFVAAIRARRPALHRWLGRIYAVGCLVGGASGLPIAVGSSAGPVASVGFALLSLGWLVTTGLGWRAAWQRDFAAHRAWMIRSFALTLAAVTLRLYLPLVPLLPIDFLDGYRAISFLCWIPNLLVAELWLRRGAPAAVEIPST